jgi:predicted tellurium resistance membrane protein TerC
MYPEPAEQAQKLALFGMAGALANTIALVLAGVFLLASWRWYFRFIVSGLQISSDRMLMSRRSSLHLLLFSLGS